MDAQPEPMEAYNDSLPDALQRAERLCDQRKGKFTAIRREVLAALLQAGEALSAYELQALMKRGGRHLKPPSIYRALEFLTGIGLVHRIESLNAYIACSQCGDTFHQPGFAICRLCGQVEEVALPQITRNVFEVETPFFKIERRVYEVEGLCGACYQAESDDIDQR